MTFEFTNPDNSNDLILVVGDPHGRLKYLSDFKDFADKTVKLIQVYQARIKFVIVLGDLFHDHSNIHIEVAGAVINFVLRIANASQVYILTGNHDQTSASQYLPECSALTILQHIHPNVHIISRPEYIDGFAFIPYVPPGRFNEAFASLFAQNDKQLSIKALFAHQEFKGAMFNPGVESAIEEQAPVNIPLIISGHVHTRQHIGNVLYVGTPAQFTFGDDENKAVSLFKFNDDGTHTEERVDLKCRKYITSHFDLDYIDENTMLSFDSHHHRYMISGTLEQLLSFKKSKLHNQLVDKNIKLVFVKKETERIQKAVKTSFIATLAELVSNETEYVQSVFADFRRAFTGDK